MCQHIISYMRLFVGECAQYRHKKRGTQVETRRTRLAPSAYQISAAATRANVAAVLACNCHGDVVDGGLDGMPSSLLLTPSRVEQVGAASVRSWDGTSQQAFPLTAQGKLYASQSVIARGISHVFSRVTQTISNPRALTTRLVRCPAPSREGRHHPPSRMPS